MATLFEWTGAQLGRLHASRVLARFLAALQDVPRAQATVLRRVLPLVRDGAFGRAHRLHAVHTVADLRRAMPLHTYEDYRPVLERVADGDRGALFAPGVPLLMFATSSGTTAKPKLIPVTEPFVADYRRGWNTFGLKLLLDHRGAFLRPILQCTGRPDEDLTRSGVPYGAITGLLARTQKRIVRHFYVGCPEVAYLPTPQARYYTLMRLALARDLGFAITASPATLIQMAKLADEQRDRIVADIHAGTLAPELVADESLHVRLAPRLRPDPARARELERLIAQHGALRPRDAWRVSFLACWTGGSMGHYLPRLREWWGDVPVRDIGLLASEGRVSVPLHDETPTGVLDVTSAVFEFIPADEAGQPNPRTLLPRELQVGHDYVVVLTNTSGLLRYRLDDVVRVHGWHGGAPIIEFLHRFGRVASVAGEKLTESQVVAAVQEAVQRLGLASADFLLAPVWDDPPWYRLSWGGARAGELAAQVDRALVAQNDEYASRRKSGRLGPLATRPMPGDAFTHLDARLAAARRSTAEQYKRPCLLTNPGDDDRLFGHSESVSTQFVAQ